MYSPTRKDEKILRKLIQLYCKNHVTLNYSYKDLAKIIKLSLCDTKTSIYSLEKHKLISVQYYLAGNFSISIPEQTLYYFENKKQERNKILKTWLYKISIIVVAGIILLLLKNYTLDEFIQIFFPK